MVRLLISLSCILSFVLNAIGQPDAYTHINEKNGLPQNSVKGMCMDEAGFLWIGTESGVVRFDGSLFRTYSISSHSNRVAVIVNNRAKNSILISSELKELSAVKSGRIYKYNYRDTLLDGYRFKYTGRTMDELPSIKFYNDTAGTFHTLHYSDKEILSYDNDRKRRLLTDRTFCIFAANGRLYSINPDLSVGLLDEKSNGFTRKTTITGHLKPSALPHTIFCPSTGNFSEDAIAIVDNNIYNVSVNADGTILHFTFLKEKPPVKTEEIIAVLYDKKRSILYVGTFIDGLYYARVATGFRILEGTVGKSFSAIAGWKDNSILTTTTVYGQNGHTENFRMRSPSPEWLINTVLTDHHGDAFIFEKYVLKAGWQNNNRSPKQVFDINRPNAIFEDMDHRIWLLGNFKTSELYVYDNTDRDKKTLLKVFKEITQGQQEAYIAQDTFTGQVFVVANKGVIHCFNRDLSLADKIKVPFRAAARSIFVPKRGSLIITTYGEGMFYYENNKLTRLPLDKQGNLKFAHCIMEDTQHYYWISTNNGLYRVYNKEIEQAAKGKNTRVNYLRIDHTYGFLNNEFNGGCLPCGTKLKDGSFVFPNLDGLVVFNPLKVYIQKAESDILIDDIIIDGKHWEVSDTIHCRTIPKRLQINLALAYYGNINDMGIEYKIEGDANNWIEYHYGKPLVYTSVPTGFRKIIIRLSDPAQPGTYFYKYLYIDTPLKYYQTIWFTVLCIASILMVFFVFTRIRTYRLQKQYLELEQVISDRTQELEFVNRRLRANNEELYQNQVKLTHSSNVKKRIMSILLHDILGPIRFIALASKGVIGNVAPESKKDMENISISSENLLLHSMELLKWLQTQKQTAQVVKTNVNLHEQIEEKRLVFLPVLKLKKMTFVNNVDPGTVIFTDRNIFSIVLYNLLDNSLKYSKKGSITIGCEYRNSRYTINVKDSGEGIPPDKLLQLNGYQEEDEDDSHHHHDPPRATDMGFGLGWQIISESLKMLGAAYHIESKLGQGTAVNITLPVEQENVQEHVMINSLIKT